MNMKSLIVISICLMLISGMAHAQYANVLYDLKPNEYSMGMNLAFSESAKLFSGVISYGISKSLNGYLSAGLAIPDKNKYPYSALSDFGISIPPAPTFQIGISSVDKLWNTGLNYWEHVYFGLGFAKTIDDLNDRNYCDISVNHVVQYYRFNEGNCFGK